MLKIMPARLEPIMLFKIAHYALEQCTKFLPIMLKLRSINRHYTPYIYLPIVI